VKLVQPVIQFVVPNAPTYVVAVKLGKPIKLAPANAGLPAFGIKFGAESVNGFSN
jgi:hypothetical protein